jgi:hypothetical protein
MPYTSHAHETGSRIRPTLSCSFVAALPNGRCRPFRLSTEHRFLFGFPRRVCRDGRMCVTGIPRTCSRCATRDSSLFDIPFSPSDSRCSVSLAADLHDTRMKARHSHKRGACPWRAQARGLSPRLSARLTTVCPNRACVSTSLVHGTWDGGP